MSLRKHIIIKEISARASLKKVKREYYSKLDIKSVIDKFWNAVKPFLLDKAKTQRKITLVEKDEIVSKDKKLQLRGRKRNSKNTAKPE